MTRLQKQRESTLDSAVENLSERVRLHILSLLFTLNIVNDVVSRFSAPVKMWFSKLRFRHLSWASRV